MDTLTPDKRSYVMGQVKSKDTKPEMIVRKLVYSLGYRYRLHVSTLPGRPDLVFKSRKKVIFVHGCFWHQHFCRSGLRRPKSNEEFWDLKLDENVERDKKNQEMLDEMGWETLIIWECEIKDADSIENTIYGFMEDKDEGA